MAKQTINIGASPNDGTGTPLRTAFDYTNQNFTELYTATGPSGNNIVVPGNATITGDLTVDTNVLKVDSANNRVGILTASPAYPLSVAGRISYSGAIGEGADTTVSSSGTSLLFGNSATWTETQFFAGGNLQYRVQSSGVFTWLDGAGGTRMTLNSTGLGVGVAPSAKLDVVVPGTGSPRVRFNGDSDNPFIEFQRFQGTASNFFGSRVQGMFGGMAFWVSNSAAIGSQTFTQAMTLDASGNLLCGATTGTSHNLRKQGSTIEGDTHLNVGNAEHLFFACSSVTYNAAAAAYKVTRNSSTLRSINAGGTINASGADYAEYMVKCGDFTLSKGGIAGIDANGKLTNVFADAISFVVKSTDPSYVGNDKWGVDLEGDALEAARQLVDRIAFAGQVPVNVIGAKAGDYIVPVVDGTGIKGIAVTSPTFEQYQIAVGKVIAIDADGRARIIVKLA